MWLLSVDAHLKPDACICNGLQDVWQSARREFASKDFLRVGIDVVFDGTEESRRELGSGNCGSHRANLPLTYGSLIVVSSLSTFSVSRVLATGYASAP
jgi:hypothetical protein